MHRLSGQATSSLLPFSTVTVEALRENELTLDSDVQGRFTVGRRGLAWLSCGPHLEIIQVVTGDRLSAYRFSDGGESPPTLLAVRDFSWLKRSGLLVGLEKNEGNMLCLYDLGLSRVVKAVAIPGRITGIEPLVSYGGASASTQHLHQSLRWFFGIAVVVTDLGHVLLVDLCLDDLSASQSEVEASTLQVVTKSPADIPRLREVCIREGQHICLQLNGPSGPGVTALQYISRTNHLAVGFSNGYLQLWNMKTLKREYHSQLEGGAVPVYAFTFQEPENDPRNCCYLWAVQSSQDLEGDTVSLHLLQLAFSERKCLSSGKILYEGLEYCEERYSQVLGYTGFPHRAPTTNTRLLHCQTIEKYRPHPDRDDSVNEVASPDTSVALFSWQVKAYGQGSPSTYIGVFDINRWYHAQMPDSLRMGESLQNCPYLAVWSLDHVVHKVSTHLLLDLVVHERSLSRGLPFTRPPPEQFFNPTTYNFDATCLLTSGVVHLTCSGYQKETLTFLRKAAPCSGDVISTIYSRCLMSGLLSSRLADSQTNSPSQEEQLDAILSTAVEASSLGLITGCIKQWTAEEQPGSALNLRYILDWAWNKVIQTKEELDGICAPLFDSSSNFIDPQTLQLLQHNQRMLGNLSAIFHCLLTEAQDLTQKGLVGLINKNMVSRLISQYAEVVVWFCRTGLLPEGSDEDLLQISRPFFTHSVISNYYTIRREELSSLVKGQWSADCLMIDGMVDQCGEQLTSLWRRDEGGTGQYPPPTLHALLDIYLLHNIDETTKHAIVIYLLLDVMHSFPNKDGAAVHSFPSAFAIPVGLVKLVQGLWLLDHHGWSSFELLLHPAAAPYHFKWQHERVLNTLMCQGKHSIALRYLQLTKPLINSTSQAKLCLSVLLHNRCLSEAWSLVRQHSNRLNMSELLEVLFEKCQELDLIKDLFKLPLRQREQECLEKFLQGTGGLQNRELLMVYYLQQANYIPALQLNHRLKLNLVNERDPKLKQRSNSRNSILEQYGKVLPKVQRKLAMDQAKPYEPHYTVHRQVSRPQPLSTVSKPSTSGKVMSRAGFINNVLTKILEVWANKDSAQESSPSRTPKTADYHSPGTRTYSPSAAPGDFLGTPFTMTNKRKSRLMDLLVQPSCQNQQSLLSPPRTPKSWLSGKDIGKAPELSLLQTPQVVKRARALAASVPVFSAFTPQSILRSSLRPTPVATPSASPGRSITPPLRSKENRITFIHEAQSPDSAKDILWSSEMAADTDVGLLTKGPALTEATGRPWSSQPTEEGEGEAEGEKQLYGEVTPWEHCISSEDTWKHVHLRGAESESSSINEKARGSQRHLHISFDPSERSVLSTDSTLEDCGVPLGIEVTDEDDEVVTVNVRALDQGVEQEQKSANFTLLTPTTGAEDVETAADQMDDHEDMPSPAESNTVYGLAPKSQEKKATDTEPELQCEAQNPTECAGHHLIGGDLSSSLTRAGIHSTSHQNQSFHSEFLSKVEMIEQTAVEMTAASTNQKSNVSVTSSEPTADSHSVVTVYDSEDLSSPESEDEDESGESDRTEEEEKEENEEDEDSGSEVEIIQEVHGSGSKPPLQSTHPLPTESEQEAAQFSLDPTTVEMKAVEEDMEGEVVMVHVRTSEEGMEDEEQDSSPFMELKPSTTFLVPLELVDGQPDLVDGAHLDLPDMEDLPAEHRSTESHCSFSLMIDMEEDDNEELLKITLEKDLTSPCLPVEDGIIQLEEQETPFHGDVTPYGQSTPAVEVLQRKKGDEDKLESGLVEADLNTEPECEEHEQHSTELTDTQSPLRSQHSTDVDTHSDVLENMKSAAADMENGPNRTLAPAEEPIGTAAPAEDPVGPAAPAEEPVGPAAPAEEPVGPAAPAEEPVGTPAQAEEPVETPAQAEEPVETPAQAEEPVGSQAEEPVGSQGEEPVGAKAEEPVGAKAEEPAVATAGEQNSPEHNQMGSGEEISDSAVEEQHVEEQQQEEEQQVKQQQQEDKEEGNEDGHRASAERKERTEVTKRITRQRQRKDEGAVITLLQEELLLETTPYQRKKPPSTPTRRSTRKSVQFVSSLSEKQEQELRVEPKKISASPRRTPRKTHPRSGTPASSALKVLPEMPTEEEEQPGASDIQQPPTEASPPAVLQLSKRSRESSTRSVVGDQTKGEDEDSITKQLLADKTFPKTTSRRTRGSSRVKSTPLKGAEEQEVLDKVYAPPHQRSSRKMKLHQSEEEEEEDEKKQDQELSRATRKSRRISQISHPQSWQSSISANTKEREDEKSSTDPLTRSRLWGHPKEELPLLKTPLELDYQTPVADALIKRLQDEEENQDSASGPDQKSIIYTPSRRRTRANPGGTSPGPKEEDAVTVSHSRRNLQDALQDDAPSNNNEADSVSTTRRTRRQTTRSKTVAETPLEVQVDLISPLPSPGEPQRGTKADQAPFSSMNLRKRVLDKVYTKPVTRRRKL